MIKHVVLFKLKEFESEDQKAVVRNKIKNALLSLRGKIDELKYIEVGNHFQLQSNSFDLCLITHFDSYEGMEAYQINPEHLKVLDLIRANMVNRAHVDFEI
jgi:hypothetical protein